MKGIDLLRTMMTLPKPWVGRLWPYHPAAACLRIAFEDGCIPLTLIGRDNRGVSNRLLKVLFLDLEIVIV